MDLSIDHPDIGKKAGERCKYLAEGGGCSIYHQGRPQLCVSYRCLWHFGVLPEGYRPDECGVLYASRWMDELCRVAEAEYVVVAHEVQKGALGLAENKSVINLLRQTKVVYCTSLIDETFYEFRGPADKGEKLVEYFRTKTRYLHSPVMEAMEMLEDWPCFV